MKDIFFPFTLHDMKTNWWQIFTDEGHLFYINGMQINRCQNFKHVRHLFYINGMQRNRLGYFTDEGHLFYINGIKPTWGENLQKKDIFITLILCKHTAGKIYR